MVFTIDPSDLTKKQSFTGVVDTSGVQITSVVWTSGTNQTHTTGATVVDYIDAAHISAMTKGILVHADQDGTLKAGSVDNTAVVADGVLTAAKFAAGVLIGTDGYYSDTRTWTYASATTFTISGVDVTAQFPVGTKLLLTQTTPKYFYVVSSSFSTNTTVTVTGGTDYTIANAAITTPKYSYEANPQGFPNGFSYTPTETGFTATTPTRVSRFWVNGRACTVSTTRSSNETSNATSYTFSLPITARTVANQTWRGIGTGQNNSAALTTAVFVKVASAATAAGLFTDGNSGTWTGSGTKGADFDVTYEI